MANSIELREQYTGLLDEVYKVNSKTSMLDAPPELVREAEMANTIYLAKMALDALGDYSKGTGFVSGDATLTWESHTFSQDRGRSFQVDAMDNKETADIAFGSLSGEFIRTNVVPEVDAYRFAQMFANAGTTAEADLTASTTVEAIDTGVEVMDDAEVPMEGRILFVTSSIYNNIKNSDLFTRNIEIKGRDQINRTFDMFDDMVVVKVPQSRFYSEITLYDGTTGGQEAGGYIKTDTTGRDLNFMIVHPSAVASIVKHRQPRVFSPNGEEGLPVNQDADAWKYDYRLYHDLFILDNKTDGIYAHNAAS